MIQKIRVLINLVKVIQRWRELAVGPLKHLGLIQQ